MRVLISMLVIAAFSAPVFAGDGPTKAQCKMGWKSSYSKMWTKEQFKDACKSMM